MTYQCMRVPSNKHKNGQSEPGDYLQLRKDAMRIPKQFFFKSQRQGNSANMDDYFSFNAATEEAKDDEQTKVNRKRKQLIQSSSVGDNDNSENRSPQR